MPPYSPLPAGSPSPAARGAGGEGLPLTVNLSSFIPSHSQLFSAPDYTLLLTIVNILAGFSFAPRPKSLPRKALGRLTFVREIGADFRLRRRYAALNPYGLRNCEFRREKSPQNKNPRQQKESFSRADDRRPRFTLIHASSAALPGSIRPAARADPAAKHSIIPSSSTRCPRSAPSFPWAICRGLHDSCRPTVEPAVPKYPAAIVRNGHSDASVARGPRSSRPAIRDVRFESRRSRRTNSCWCRQCRLISLSATFRALRGRHPPMPEHP